MSLYRFEGSSNQCKHVQSKRQGAAIAIRKSTIFGRPAECLITLQQVKDFYRAAKREGTNYRNTFERFRSHMKTGSESFESGMREAKTIVYRYDDIDATEEEETDLSGEIEMPRPGDILFRTNQAWKVMAIYPGYGSEVPRFRVLLMDASKPHFVN